MIFFFTATFTVWIVLSAAAQEDLRWQHEERVIEDLALQLQDDLYLSAQLPEGYRRNISLPGAVVGKDYDLILYDPVSGAPYFTIACEDHLVEKDLPEISLPGDEQAYTADRLLIITNHAGSLEVGSP